MLGKLFNLTGPPVSGAGSDNTPSSQPVSSLESVQEDIHTRNLVYPDAQALHQHRNHQVFPLPTASTPPIASGTGAFDHDANFELESRDIRVVIMQDALGSMPASLLYDSQAAPPPPDSPDRPASTAGMSHFNIEPRRTPLSPRRPSMGFAPKPVVIQPDSPQPRQGPFDRRQSIQARAQPRIESDSQRAYREYTDELAVFSSCIFGSAELLAYKGTSTKVHVVPSEPSRPDLPFSIAGDGRGSLGRSSMRASKLSQSFSSEHTSPFGQAASSPPVTRPPDNKKVLITRLFPVTLPTVDDIHSMTPHSRFSEDSSGYPFPSPSDEAKSKKKRSQLKQKRTPMYAIALVITLPQAGSGPSSSKATMRGPGSYTEQDSFPSSYGSHQRSGWSMVSPSVAHELGDPSSGVDTEERIDPITQHWDIIMRTLTHLQSVVATTIFTFLKHADINSPDPFPSSITSHLSRNSSVSGRRSEDGMSAPKPPKTNAKTVTLMPNCLMENLRIKTEVDTSRTRIVTGIRAMRVVTGQNRWGIWREEARWVERWTKAKDNDFYSKLLSGFLATHTEWLQALSPEWYRRRHYQQEKSKPEEDTALASRTILVAGDKMAARRLLFLLSAFLPAHQQLPTLRAHRASTSATWGVSQSPPSLVVPILKEESLRRKLNRRPGNRQGSHSRNASLQDQTARPFVIPGHLAHLNMDRRHERRPSDTASIRTMNLPITGSEINRKSSAATVTSVASDATTAHFTRVQSGDSQFHRRPDSSGGVAEDLKRTLRRGDSTGQYSRGSTDSNQSSRWGSMISGFWNARRRDSTSLTTHTRETSGVGDDVPISPTKSLHRQKTDTLSRMVREAQLSESPAKDPSGFMQSGGVRGGDSQPQTPRLLTEGSQEFPGQRNMSRESSQRIPNPAGAFESPVKTSINLEDGVIDVDVPFPEYITSFETAVSSPSSSGYLSTGLEAFEQSCRIDIEGDVPPNVAGWLQQYHPDFVLQAIPPQSENLLEQVKASMRAEPSPAQPPNASNEARRDRWLDISTALIADATTFRLTRLRYRRLVRPKAVAQDRTTPLLSVSAQSYGNAGPTTPAVSPYEMHLEDEFIQEDITTFDDILTNAVHRVIALGGPGDSTTDPLPIGSGRTSGLGSSDSSRSASIRRGRSNSASTDHDTNEPATIRPRGPLLPSALPLPLPPKEVPKGQCKAVVLSALEEIVREVVKERERGGKGEPRSDNVLRAAVGAWLENVENGAE